MPASFHVCWRSASAGCRRLPKQRRALVPKTPRRPAILRRPRQNASASALPRPPNRPKPSRAAINKLITRYAKRYGLENDLVHAVVRAESGYNAHAVSPAGAVGLMQIMPATGADYGVGSADALFDAPTNIRVGTRHLQRLIGRYGVGKAIMAYNAGEGALERHNGFVTYPETQRYTHRVLTSYLQKKGLDPIPARRASSPESR